MKTTKTTENNCIELKPVKIVKTVIEIVGDSPLIVHAWSEKAKRMMLEAQQKTAKAKKAREARDPFAEFIDSMYWLDGKPKDYTEKAFQKAVKDGARFGFPISAIKQAAISAAYRSGSTKDKMSMRGIFFLNGIDNNELATIQFDDINMREDMVRIGMGSADLRYRAEFTNWRAKLVLTYNDNGVFTLEQIINAINLGGFMCGIGEWRPEKDGQNGMYHVNVEGRKND